MSLTNGSGGSPPTWNAGTLGNELVFTAANKSYTNNAAWSQTDDYTFSMAVLFKSTVVTGVLFNIGDTPDSAPLARFQIASSKGRFLVYDLDGATSSASSTNNTNDGEWHLLVGRCDGTDIYLYTDGADAQSAACPPGSMAYMETARMGASHLSTPGTYLSGTITMAAAWDVDIGTAGVASLAADPWGVVRAAATAAKLVQNTYRQMRA